MFVINGALARAIVFLVDMVKLTVSVVSWLALLVLGAAIFGAL